MNRSRFAERLNPYIHPTVRGEPEDVKARAEYVYVPQAEWDDARQADDPIEEGHRHLAVIRPPAGRRPGVPCPDVRERRALVAACERRDYAMGIAIDLRHSVRCIRLIGADLSPEDRATALAAYARAVAREYPDGATAKRRKEARAAKERPRKAALKRELLLARAAERIRSGRRLTAAQQRAVDEARVARGVPLATNYT